MKTFGKILLGIGALLIAFTAFQLITAGQLAEVDPMEINNPNKLSFYWSPITAIACLVAGVVILVINKKEKKRIHKYYR